MRITDLLSKDGILLKANYAEKSQIFDTLINLHEKCGSLKNKEEYKTAVYAREAQVPTAIERGIVIPHAKTDAVKKASITVMVLENAIDCNSLDKLPSDLFFMLAVPCDDNLHIEILSRLMTLLTNDEFSENLRNAKTAQEFLEIIDIAEAEKLDAPPPEKIECYNILAVTACPTGIAHTFMAAEALQQAATNQGYTIKVETNGSDGAKNKLTEQEIALADAIIVAADIGVDITRFNGKPVIFTTVTSGISSKDGLVKKAMSGSVPIYRTQIDTEAPLSGGKKIRQQLYTHLMSGISYMLPFIVGGGILIALSYAMDDFTINPINFGMNTPIASFFKSAGIIAFQFILPIMSAFIAYSIADRVGLCIGFVGGAFAYTGINFTNYTQSVFSNGSGFFGAIIAGFLAGWIVLFLRKIFSRLPKSMNGLKSTFIFPLLGIIMISAVMCIVNPFAISLSTHMLNILTNMGQESRILLGCVLGAMMSIDMGGPIGKTAYLFGTASIAMSDYEVMASVMIGGMVAPLAIAFAATLFKSKFKKSERKSAYMNYILGLCFVTEGAIPFAATDGFRVIPACVIGSALAGGLSMLYKCQLYAPHGGIFIFPLVKNVIGYLIALLIGTIVAGLIIGITKRTVPVKDRL